MIFFSIIRAHLADLDMNATDYDGKTTNKTRNRPILGGAGGPGEPKITTFSGRTALHLAACEGHLACVR